MARPTWRWVHLLGAVAVCMALTSAAEAQCAKCYWPPPYTSAQCGNTYYNGANACVVSGAQCSYLGTCQGQLGDECESGPGMCPFDKWTCGRPLAEEWRLEAYSIERPAPVAEKTRKNKA